MQHLLIDFENIQPNNLDNLLHPDLNILIFFGANQKKMDIHLSESLCNLQNKVKKIHFIYVKQVGKNALDFCLAYYIGRITLEDKNADITILSKDTDYDSLISQVRHENTAKSIRRKAALDTKGAAPALLQAPNPLPAHAFKTILAALVSYPTKLPTEQDKLIKVLKSLVKKKLNIKDQELCKKTTKNIFERLLQQGFIQQSSNQIRLFLGKQDFEKRLVADIVSKHPRSMNALHNIIQQHIDTKTNLDFSEKLAINIINLMQKQNILQINGDRLHYPDIDGELENKSDSLSQNAQRIVSILNKVPDTSLPSKKESLLNCLRSWMGKNIKPEIIIQLIRELINFNYIAITNNGMVTYHLEKQ